MPGYVKEKRRSRKKVAFILSTMTMRTRELSGSPGIKWFFILP